MTDTTSPGAQKARILANLILALGLFCLVGEMVFYNLHSVIHRVIHFDSDMVCEQTQHQHCVECDKDVAASSSGGEASIEIVRERVCASSLLTYPVFLSPNFPPPKTI